MGKEERKDKRDKKEIDMYVKRRDRNKKGGGKGVESG